jgi:RNA polymerase sigma-70 factor (ECF subfamily)
MEAVRYTPRELVERIRAGERAFEDALVLQYSRGVQFLISQSVSDGSVVEDLYQECFRMVLEKVRAGEVSDPDRLSGFICSLARNIVIEYFRKTSRREGYHVPANHVPADEDAVPSREPSQLDRLLRDEKGSLARRVLDALPSDRDRSVLYRFYIAEDDREEICADLGIEATLLSQILCRARQRYKTLFEEYTAAQRKSARGMS